MSSIYKANKSNGCKWCGGPREFIRANKKMLGINDNQIPKKGDFNLFEKLLIQITRKVIEKPPVYQNKAVSGYTILKEYLATEEGKTKWQQVRFEVLRKSNGRCCLCGASSSTGATLHVDHIKPKSLHPELAFEISNLQVLCEDCNMGKGNRSDDDFRSKK